MFVTIAPSAGCTYLITGVANRSTQERVKTLKLPSSRALGFSECLQSDGGLCPAARPSANDILSDRAAPMSSARPLSTHTASPRLALIENGKLRSQASLQSDLNQLADAVRPTQNDLEMLQGGAAAAERARAVLNSGVQAKLNAIFNIARGVPTADAAPPSERGKDGKPLLTIDIQAFNTYLDDLEEATSIGGWDALVAETPFCDSTPEDARRRVYIAAYFKAYFRNGKFYQATLDGSKLKQQVVAALQEVIPGASAPAGKDPYDELAGKLFEQLDFNQDGQFVLGKINSDGLVTRGGQQLKFPSIEAELSLTAGKIATTRIDYIAVGADLIRVLLHAIYDAHDRLPGVTAATGYSVAAYSRLGRNEPEVTHVEAEEFAAIESRSVQIEAATSSGIGRLIRGLGFVALNNEALATAIETAVGVAVRKHSEKILWCWYACELDAKTPLADYAPLSSEGQVSIAIGFSGEPADALGQAKAWR